MAFNLLAELDDERFGADALARAHDEAAAAGLRLSRVRGTDDDRLAAWIDLTFPASFWSSEVRAANVWIAERGNEIAGFAAFAPRHLRYTWLRTWQERRGVGIFGPYGVAPAERGGVAGRALLTAALYSLRAAGNRDALIPAVSGERLVATYRDRTGARVAEEFTYPSRRIRTTIFASGAGTNARNVLERSRDGTLPVDVAAIVVNHADAGAVAIAREFEVPVVTVEWSRATETRAEYDARILTAVASTAPELVLLLGWMHLLEPEFLLRYRETLNVHPSFLPFDQRADEVVMPDGSTIPALRGARAVQDAVQRALPWTGVTVHRVTSATDRGAVMVRTPLRVEDTPTAGDLLGRLRPLEFAAVTQAIRRWTFER